jgi:hypothetical protein
MDVYYGSFENWKDVLNEFSVEDESMNDVIPLFASYNHEGYEGDATVVYMKDQKLWLVQGSHCSCYGLENQWQPEDMPLEALEHLCDAGNYSFSDGSCGFKTTLEFIRKAGFDGSDLAQLEFFLKLRL